MLRCLIKVGKSSDCYQNLSIVSMTKLHGKHVPVAPGDRDESASGWAQSSEPAEGAGGGDNWAKTEEHSAEPAGSVWRLRTLSQGMDDWVGIVSQTEDSTNY